MLIPGSALLFGEVLTYSFAEVVVHPLDACTRPVELLALRWPVSKVHCLAKELFGGTPGFFEDQRERPSLFLCERHLRLRENANNLITDFIQRIAGGNSSLVLSQRRNGRQQEGNEKRDLQ